MNLFVPDMYEQSIYKINYKKLKERGIKCILFDLDNTMASYKEDKPSKKLKEHFAYLTDEFKVIIISNSPKERVRAFKEGLNVDAAHSAKKPLKTKYKKILALNKFKREQIACVGDQIMTDIIGANRMGMVSILVNSMGSEEPATTKVNRFWENIILKKLQKKGILHKGEYYD